MILLACKKCGSTRINIGARNQFFCSECNTIAPLYEFDLVEIYGNNTLVKEDSEKVIKDEVCQQSEEISENTMQGKR